MDNPTEMICFCVGVLTLLLFVQRRFDPSQKIPAIGPSAPLLSYIGAYRYFRHAQDMLQKGYTKYRGSVFRVPLLDQWVVVVSGAKMNEELWRIPDDKMSFLAAAQDFIQTKYTIAPLLDQLPIHVKVMREQLTRNLGVLLPGVLDEIHAAFNEIIPTLGNEWVSISGLPVMTHIIARVSNRAFVGLPICRDSDYLDVAMKFPMDVMKGKSILSIVPKSLKAVVGPCLPWSRRALRCFSAHLKPVIAERQRLLQELGEDWTDKPIDMLMWLIEEAPSMEQSVDLIVQSILSSNFASTHTSSISLTHALYHLAGSPEYMHPLREEIENVLKVKGWTKDALSNMWRLDSFLRESQRLNGVSGMSVMRKALKDVTLSDGTYIPTGTMVYAAATATHRDPDNYDNPDMFDPFRFSDAKESENDRIKQQYVSTSPDYIPFGHGKHACPGRFFASHELKAILAHIVLNYDLQFEGGGGRPENLWLGTGILPAPNAKIMFRNRQTSDA
uniref:Cytochrome P450 monooxygenase n=1 Tax=Taiwanofungus camphoratus TaxID=2696576 RepID=H9LFA2_TAICA|nr:cytochrome P450 monooxygenase [Antrodia cinnamomea]